MDTMLDVLSALDSNDEPVYSNCTLQMGEVALEFKNGRSKVAERYAPEVMRNPKIMVPGYTGPAAAKVPNVAAEIAGDVRQQRQESPAETEARVAASEEYLRSQGIPIPERVAPVAPSAETEGLKARIAELEKMVAGAADLSAARAAHDAPGPVKGSEVVVPADVVPGETPGWPVDPVTGEPLDLTPEQREALAAVEIDTIPDGIESVTADGQLRCWARKGDGTQCSNASLEDSHACGLAAHKKLVK